MMGQDKKKTPGFEELLRSAAKQGAEFVPHDSWADEVMADIRQLSLEERNQPQSLGQWLFDYIDAVSMAFWRFVPASAMALLLFGILYSFYNPIDDTLTQVWNNQHDAFLWIELLGI